MLADPAAPLHDDPALEARIPVATYRLQLNPSFTFSDAERLVSYLAALGVSDVYASPYLAARPGSPHGYDLVDHGTLNPELGSREDFDRFAATLQARGMGQLLDVVPNHMGIAQGANRWWNDVLENGPSSPYAEFFDIDWEPVKRELAGKILLPILGDQYGRVLENQELVLELLDGAFRIRYHETRLPVDPGSAILILRHRLEALTATLGEADPSLQEYLSIITALGNLPPRTETAPDRVQERVRERDVIRRRLGRLLESSPAIRQSIGETVRVFNGQRGDPRSFDLLDRLLSEQAYRLAHWRVAAEEINFRRFFDINELAAIRMENPAVFAEAHRLIWELVEAGKVTGLRIDHPDGLFDPRAYFFALQRERLGQRIRERFADDAVAATRLAAAFTATCGVDPRRPGCRPLYVVAEKILAKGERLPARWAVHGTTGYEFLNLVGGLFVDAAGARALTATYTAFTGKRESWSDLVYQSKQLIMDSSMSSELSVLGHALSRLAERNRYSRDFTLASLTHALKEVIACFPVYRTYITAGDAEIALQDRACIEVAVAFAKRRNPTTNVSTFDFVRDILLLRYPDGVDDAYRADQRAFVQRFQQLTAPVTAKGVEDTAAYRYNRLVSLNEVGGDPDQFGISVEEFHRHCVARQEQWPHGLSATATHDTKRGEDVRARIHVLSELPRDWRAAVRRWHRQNRRQLGRVDDHAAPDRNDEYLLYQTLIGAWPLAPAASSAAPDFVERIQAYMLKAIREAKIHTSWINPNGAYEEAMRAFIAAILAGDPRSRFRADFAAFHRPVAFLGGLNGLGQAVLKVAAPGVPDLYQGSELWDLNLVDPDNRRPVDFAARERALAELRARLEGGDLKVLIGELLAHWEDGRLKLYTLHRALECRGAWPDVFRSGAYVPLRTEGRHAAHLCALARVGPARAVVVAVPRLMARLTAMATRLPLGVEVWDDTAVVLPPEVGRGPFHHVYTGASVGAIERGGGLVLSVAELLAEFPVALLRGETAASG
jgi:(1->4)-alpha-D-glucan 1-alpha-D-glucosylmutase